MSIYIRCIPTPILSGIGIDVIGVLTLYRSINIKNSFRKCNQLQTLNRVKSIKFTLGWIKSWYCQIQGTRYKRGKEISQDYGLLIDTISVEENFEKIKQVTHRKNDVDVLWSTFFY